MTTTVTITVPEHVKQVDVKTESYHAQDHAWVYDAANSYGPGAHTLHIWDTKRIASITEWSETTAGAGPSTFGVGDVVVVKGQEVLMTVHYASDGVFQCIWFDDDQTLCAGNFAAAVLERAPN